MSTDNTINSTIRNADMEPGIDQHDVFQSLRKVRTLHCWELSLDGNNRNKQKMYTGRKYLLNWRTSGSGRREKFNEGSACL